MYRVLAYEYVDEMLERRKPYREVHLARVDVERQAGRIVMSGPVGDPPTGALIVFAGEVGVEEIETFVAGDPYVEAGLVTSWRIEPWAAH
jgi:uncharacterized protein YciI